MNELFPIFLKMHQINTLLVGGGNVGLEKLHAITKSSPNAKVHIVAKEMLPETLSFIEENKNLSYSEREFKESDLNSKDLVILATNNTEINAKIRKFAAEKNILINVADKPDLCDFYLGSVVRKGNLKIGISTNGKSPTMAKRLREFFEEMLPEEIDETLNLLSELRNGLKGDFREKVKVLNARTKEFLYDRAN